MFDEKAEAAAIAGFILMSRGSRGTPASILAPWRRRAVANARRLRKK
jgi:hypothetical protein